MRIGYCSPFNPMKSGISDFSEELIFALAEHMEVIIFSPVKPDNEKVLKNFEVYSLSELGNTKIRETLDHIVYHIGNNGDCHGDIIESLRKYPGIVELHEWGLHHLAAQKTLEMEGKDSYMRMVRYCHGERGMKIAEAYLAGQSDYPWESHPMDMNMARPYIEQATGIIVHTEMVKQLVLGVRSNVPIVNIMLHSLDIVENPDEFSLECRKKLNLSCEKLIMGAFGFATTNKRILPILDALERVRKINSSFLYILVGEVEKGIDIQKELKERNLCENVIVTGFVSLEDFKSYMGACDFCFNLRYPTQGESSGSLHRMLGMGKPAIVTDIGTFSDYPDDVVIKVRYDRHEVEDIYNAVILLINKKGELRKRSKAALAFAKAYCDLKKNAVIYADFFEQVHKHTWQSDWEDSLITHLCELGLTDDTYLRELYSKMICR